MEQTRQHSLIQFDSGALGDTMAWIPYCEEYRKATGFDVTVSCDHYRLFDKNYPEINFTGYAEPIENIHHYFSIGWLTDSRNMKIPMQQSICNQLNIPYTELKTNLLIPNWPPPIENKYVVIATQSTAQAKYWNNPDGWPTVINYLKEQGYEVICIDQHTHFGNPKSPPKNTWINKTPDNVIDKSGKDLPLEDRMVDIYHADMFIGLGSGLSWLAWTIGTPVIMISGFSPPEMEMQTGVWRIDAPEDKCKHCFSKFKFDPGNWIWCPSDEKEEIFECTKSITPEVVIEAIDEIIELKRNQESKNNT